MASAARSSANSRCDPLIRRQPTRSTIMPLFAQPLAPPARPEREPGAERHRRSSSAHRSTSVAIGNDGDPHVAALDHTFVDDMTTAQVAPAGRVALSRARFSPPAARSSHARLLRPRPAAHRARPAPRAWPARAGLSATAARRSAAGKGPTSYPLYGPGDGSLNRIGAVTSGPGAKPLRSRLSSPVAESGPSHPSANRPARPFFSLNCDIIATVFTNLHVSDGDWP